MKISGIYITLLGVSISGITSIILAHDSNILVYVFVVTGIIITILGSYIQYKESEKVKIKINFQKVESGKYKYSFVIPKLLYKKENPIITQVGENGMETWGFTYEILQNGDIGVYTDEEVKGECFFLIH